MFKTPDQTFPNPSSFLYIGHAPMSAFVDISNVQDVLERVVAYCPKGDTLISDANKEAIKAFASEAFEAIRAISTADLANKSALVIREEAHGGQLTASLE